MIIVLGLLVLYMVVAVEKILSQYKEGSLAGKRIRYGATLAGSLMFVLSAPMVNPALFPYVKSGFPLVVLALALLCGLCYTLRRYVGLVLLIPETLLTAWASYYLIIQDIRREAGFTYGASRPLTTLGNAIMVSLLALAVIAVTAIALAIDSFIAYMNGIEARRLERARKR